VAIISTEAVAAPIDAAPSVTVTDTPDAAELGEAEAEAAGAGGGNQGDLDILAEIEATSGAPAAETVTEEAAPAAAARADEPAAEPAATPESAELRRARAILATANRKLAKANATAAATREQIIAGLKTKPHATLRELGLSIGEVLDAEPAPADEAATPKTADEQIAAIRAELQAERDASAAAAVTAQVAVLTTKVHDDIKASKDFPRINAANKGQGAHALVTDLMIEYHREHGQRLPAAEAAKQVEEFLAELAGVGVTASPAPKSNGAPSNGTQPPPKRQGSQTLANNEIRNAGPGPDDLPEDLDARAAAVMREMGLGLSN
jgi:hypothetical protein